MEPVWLITVTDVPQRRVVFGKRTSAHVFYKTFATREEAQAAWQEIVNDRADHIIAASERLHKLVEDVKARGGRTNPIPPVPTREQATRTASSELQRSHYRGPHAAQASLWPASDGSRSKPGDWQSYDKLRAFWRKQQAARVKALREKNAR